MEKWQQISLILCIFGFLKEFRPSEPFIFEFLTGPWHNATIEQVVQDVFPIGTYSYMAQLVVVFLITDYFRYKPLIIVAGLAGTLVWSMFVWCGSSLRALQVLEVFYGTYMAAEIAYWTYIYAKVDRKHYQKVTSHIRSATQAGRFLAATTSQTVIYYGVTDYLGLNYIALGAQLATTVWAFMLPPVPESMYFHRQEPVTDEESDLSPTPKNTANSTCSRASSLLWYHFKSAYTSFTVIRFSLWYSLAVCLYYQITSYVQALWGSIGGRNATLWNGAVEAILTLMGSLVALLAGFVPPSWLQVNTTLLGLAAIAMLEGLGLLVATVTSSLVVSYVGYTVFGILHAFAITLVSSEIAKHISDDSFALIFGVNTMVGLVLQTLLTVAVVDSDGWFALDIRGQFTVYGYGFLGVGVLFTVFLLVELFREKCYRGPSLFQGNKDNIG
ncbi:folate transporter 1-like [Topomyia yanbarensis]|uniref:folate transporter 1-like n=1 Tax=Topomyia yanbarensis TaxID=2498891 RepID=UPI00273A7532|nr:folate transporter 1-like [Topomyia yanbarensis]